MWYHAVSLAGERKHYFWNRSREDIFNDIIVPFVKKHVTVTTSSNVNSIYNFSAVSHLTIFKTKTKLKRAKDGGIPEELLDQNFKETHAATDEFVQEIKLLNASIDSSSLIQQAAAEQLNQIFVIMQFGDEDLDSVYEGVIKPLGEKYGYTVIRVDEIKDSGNITQQILENIAKSKIVLAELSGERPNCYYEAGYAHAIGKELIFSIHNKSKIHFDLASYRFIQWKTEADFRRQLQSRLESFKSKDSDSIEESDPNGKEEVNM